MTGKRLKHLFLLICAAVSLTAQAQTYPLEKVSVAGSDLKNCYHIGQGVYRSEQPTTADFKALEKFGIREVLNLRNWHSDDDEAAGTGLVLHRIATRASTIDEQDLVAALKIIQNRKGPIVFHCLHGSDRTGAVCAMYRIVFQNMPKEKAVREMTRGGFGFHFIFWQIIDTIMRADIGQIKQELNLVP